MTTFKGVTALVAEGFRGATSRFEISFAPEHPFVLLFGENGTGKSSLADAIELVAHGTKGSLADLSSTQIRDLASKGTAAPPLAVELSTGVGNWQARLQKGSARISGPTPRPCVEILRRSKLTRIVAATPAERFEQLRAFVDVEPVSRAEAALDRARKEAGDRVNATVASVAEKESELGAVWDTAGRPGDDPIAWARSLSETEAPGAVAVTREWLAAVALSLDRLRGAHQRFEAGRTKLAEAAVKLSALDQEAAADVDGDRRLVELLTAAREAVEAARELTRCPVCRQAVDADALRRDLESRLERLHEETARLEARRNAIEARNQHEAVASRAREELDGAFGAFRSAVEHPPGGLALDLVSALTTVGSAAVPAGGDDAAADAALAESLAAAEREVQAQQERLQQVAAEHLGLVRLADQITAARGEAQLRKAESDRLARCLDIVRSTRKAYTERILGEVEGEMNRLYQALHPGEPLGPIRLVLDPKQRGSLLQSATFGGDTDVTPQSCFSESHLLTLAFCLWLALAKRERPEETILVLDDIVFAVDAPHMQRLADLLAVEAQGFAQVLVTTHSRRFRRYLRDGTAPSGRLDCRALRWTLQNGISHGVAPHLAERLAQALNETILDRQAVSSRAGVLLEAVLRKLAALYGRRVPFAEPTEPTLADLFNAWKLSHAEKVEFERRSEGGDYHQIGTLGNAMRELRALHDIRNLVGGHLNLEGDEVPDQEVREYGSLVRELWELVVCGECGQIPCRAKDGFYYCHCKRTRLRPNQIS